MFNGVRVKARNKVVRAMAVLAVGAAALVPATVFAGGGPGGPCGPGNMSGLDAQAYFGSSNSSVLLMAEQGSPSSLFVAVSSYDPTTFNGSSYYGCATAPSVQISKDLSAASASASNVTLYGYDNYGNSLGAITVNVNASWTATGAAIHTVSTSTYSGPGFHFSEHMVTVSRPANATASILDSTTSSDYNANNTLQGAEMDNVKSGSVIVTH